MEYDKSTGRERHVSMLASQGQPFATEQLFHYYRPKIKRIIASRVRDKAMVDDLTQDVFIKILNGLPGFSYRAQLSSWIFQITLNTLKNYYRAEDKFKYTGLEENSLDHYIEEDPVQWVMGLDLVDKMKNASRRLPKILWHSYYLNQFEGKSYQEISIQMHCPIGTVRSRVHRARQLLKDALITTASRGC